MRAPEKKKDAVGRQVSESRPVILYPFALALFVSVPFTKRCGAVIAFVTLNPASRLRFSARSTESESHRVFVLISWYSHFIITKRDAYYLALLAPHWNGVYYLEKQITLMFASYSRER